MELSKHFTLEELTASSKAKDLELANLPLTEEILENLKMVASTLELIREVVGAPVHISSGYRCQQLNRAIGGAPNSAHVQGLAADIYVNNMPALKLAKLIEKAKIPLDQLIYEGSWVHIGLAVEGQRQQVLTAHFTGRKASYTYGLPA